MWAVPFPFSFPQNYSLLFYVYCLCLSSILIRHSSSIFIFDSYQFLSSYQLPSLPFAFLSSVFFIIVIIIIIIVVVVSWSSFVSSSSTIIIIITSSNFESLILDVYFLLVASKISLIFGWYEFILYVSLWKSFIINLSV